MEESRYDWEELEKKYMECCTAEHHDRDIRASWNVGICAEMMRKEPWESKFTVLTAYLDQMLACIGGEAPQLTEEQHQVFMVVLTHC